MFRMANAISLRSSFSSNSIRTISYGKRSWKSLLIFAPPLSSSVFTMAEPEPSIDRSKSCCSCWMLLQLKVCSVPMQMDSFFSILSHLFLKSYLCKLHQLIIFPDKNTHWSMAFVLMEGSLGLKYLYCSTSFSSESNCFCSLSRRPGRVSRMWLLNC